ncbi:MAG: CAP domain-containing protein [Eubacteriales bacterium]
MNKHKTFTRFSALLLILCMAVSMLTPGVLASESDEVTVDLAVTYGQTEARYMLEMVNEFRTGDEAWAWNSDNTEKVEYPNLSGLVYDYELEKIAMQRAAEIAISFSHTRPDGTSCWTAYTGGYRSVGENIAAGYATAEAVFEGWKETNESYSGQGHRRNMLNTGFTAIGIGHVVYNGVHYWVQEFRSPTSTATDEGVNDSAATVKVNISASQASSLTAAVSESQISLSVGDEIAAPCANVTAVMTNGWPKNTFSLTSTVDWSVGDSTILQVTDNQTLVGLKAGTTTLSATVLGETLTVAVTVDAVVPKFSLGTVNESTGTLSTGDHSAFLSTRSDTESGTFDLRLILVSEESHIQTGDVVEIVFDSAETDHTYQRTISDEYIQGSTMKLYQQVSAAGVIYTAESGCVIYGVVVTGIPANGFDSVTVTVYRDGEAIVTGTASYDDMIR